MPSKKVPSRLSLRKAVYAESVYSGRVELSSLARVRDAVMVADSEFTVELSFGRAENDKKAVKVCVQGLVGLQCQRCLGRVTTQLDTCSDIVFVAHDEEAKSVLREQDPFVLADDELDVYQLLEDEILLALPNVAMHEEGELVEGETGEAVRCEAYTAMSLLPSAPDEQMGVSIETGAHAASGRQNVDLEDAVHGHGGREASVHSHSASHSVDAATDPAAAKQNPFSVLEQLKSGR